jgi:ubiquinone/menaquinone biosynthesis C-methylase UbiE
LTEADAFTGERFLPGVVGEIAYEHCHRYAFARRYVAGRRVLDAACGEGYGSALLAEAADTVVGVDIDAQVVAKAAATYGKNGKLSFEAASVTRLPLTDASVDVVVSFETIEHLKAVDQPPMLAEFARVLAPRGILILSSPNRPEYSEARGYANPFHFHELDRDELSQLLQPRFAAQRWFHQRRNLGSAKWSETPRERFETHAGSAAEVGTAAVPPAMYFIVIAASAPESLPTHEPAVSLYVDGEDAEWKRIDHEAREVLRLDGLLVARDEMLRAQYRHSEELQAMVAHRDQVLAERTHAEERARQELLSTFTAEQERLTRQIEAQERIIGYRESVRWWLALPWLRARRVWNRIRAA